MYHYIDDKEFLSQIKKVCGEIMQCLCHTLKKEYNIGANFYLVRSGAKNLIMQNASNPIDFDYNLEIIRCEDFEDCRYIKECVRKVFNSTLAQFGWGDCQDSTSSLTTRKVHFIKGNQTEFSIDVCITFRDADNYYRLIHEKNSWTCNNKSLDRYFWNIAKDSTKIKEKVNIIKSKGKWEFVRIQYAQIKNNYLSQNDYNHPSFICYIEAINNVYNSQKYK